MHIRWTSYRGAVTQWRIHDEHLVDENPHIQLSTADVELPDGTEFTQYVIRIPQCVMAVVTDDADRLLLVRRHRFVIDRWVWEVPGGYALAERGDEAVIREVVEETGYQPVGTPELIVSYQPIIGSGDCPQDLYLLRGAQPTGAKPDANEVAGIEWFSAHEVMAMTRSGDVVGAATIMGALHVLATG